MRLLASLAPRPLSTCFRATGGSEAVDLALQAAMVHTGRRAVLSLEGSYHGNTLAGLSIGASDNRERIKNLLPHCGKIGPTLDAKALRRIEQRLKRRDVAAFVICEHFDLDPTGPDGREQTGSRVVRAGRGILRPAPTVHAEVHRRASAQEQRSSVPFVCNPACIRAAGMPNVGAQPRIRNAASPCSS